MLIKKKVFFLLISIVILSFALTGCYDLGDATLSDEDYCQTYSEIRVIDASGDVDYYTMEDFYNEEAVNDFKTPMSEDDRSEYSYLIVRVDKDLSIGEVSIFLDSTVKETVQASFFVLDEGDLPTRVYTGPGGRYSLSEMDEPSDSLVLATTTARLAGVAGKWNAVYLRQWGTGEERIKRQEVKEGQYLVVRFDNNRYDPALTALDEAESAWLDAKAEYETKLLAWQTLNNDPSATQEAKDAAMNALTSANATLAVAERDYQAAKSNYERERFPYQRVPIRITAILINAE